MDPAMVFNPSDEQIVSFYLPNLISGEGIGGFSYLIGFFDIYSTKPSTLFEGNRGCVPLMKSKERFVFSHRERISQKNANGKRPRRVLESKDQRQGVRNGGFWRSSTGEKPILGDSQRVIGYVNLLNFYEYKGEKVNVKDATKTGWLMHEYRLPGEAFQEWVICKIKDTCCAGEDERESLWFDMLFGLNRLRQSAVQETVFNGCLPLPIDQGPCPPLINNYEAGRLQQSESTNCQSSTLVGYPFMSEPLDYGCQESNKEDYSSEPLFLKPQSEKQECEQSSSLVQEAVCNERVGIRSGLVDERLQQLSENREPQSSNFEELEPKSVSNGFGEKDCNGALASETEELKPESVSNTFGQVDSNATLATDETDLLMNDGELFQKFFQLPLGRDKLDELFTDKEIDEHLAMMPLATDENDLLMNDGALFPEFFQLPLGRDKLDELFTAKEIDEYLAMMPFDNLPPLVLPGQF